MVKANPSTLVPSASATDRPAARWLLPPRMFVIIATLFGTALVILTAPFQAPDEINHFLRAYQISEGQMGAEYHSGRGGGVLPVSLREVCERFENLPFHSNVTTSRSEIFSALRVPLRPQLREFQEFPDKAAVPPVGYLPPALGIALGRSLGLPPLALMYAGRETNLLIWILICYCGLRLAPAFHRPFLLLLLTPMSLFLAASLSVDASTNALAMLFVCLIWREALSDSTSMGWKPLVALALVSAAMMLTKMGYLPLVGLVLLIPPRRFGGHSRYWVIVLALAAVNLGVLLIWSRYTVGLDAVITDRPDVSARQQVQFLHEHPTAWLTVPLVSAQRRWWAWIAGFVGRLGWLDIVPPPSFPIAYLAALLFTCRPSEQDPDPPPLLRSLVIIAIAVVGSFWEIIMLNYIFYTYIGMVGANGIQGRYFIPLAPALLFLAWVLGKRLPRRLWNARPHWESNALTALIALAACVYTVGLVYARYYVGLVPQHG